MKDTEQTNRDEHLIERNQQQNNGGRRTEWISDLEDRMMKITAARQNIEKNEDSIKDLWDNSKCTKIHYIGGPKREERKDWRKYLKR